MEDAICATKQHVFSAVYTVSRPLVSGLRVADSSKPTLGHHAGRDRRCQVLRLERPP